MDTPLFQQKLFVDLGISVDFSEAQELRNKYLNLFPPLKHYFQRCEDSIISRGYVENLVGQQYHYPCPRGKNTIGFKHFLNAAINAQIQGLASYITGDGLISLEEALLRRYNISYRDHFNRLVRHWADETGLDTSAIRDKMEQDSTPRLEYPIIIAEVHDEIVVDSPEHCDPNELNELAVTTMQKTHILKQLFPKYKAANIPLLVEASVDTHWSK